MTELARQKLQDAASWIVVEGLRDQPTCTTEEWDAVLESFAEDCKSLDVCSTTLLVVTTAQLTQAVLAPTQKLKPSLVLPLSKLRPKPAVRKR